MSLMVVPEWITAAAADVTGVGSVVGTANTAAATPTTGSSHSKPRARICARGSLLDSCGTGGGEVASGQVASGILAAPLTPSCVRPTELLRRSLQTTVTLRLVCIRCGFVGSPWTIVDSRLPTG